MTYCKIAFCAEGDPFWKITGISFTLESPSAHGQCVHVSKINMHKQFLFMGEEKLGGHFQGFLGLLKVNGCVYFSHCW